MKAHRGFLLVATLVMIGCGRSGNRSESAVATDEEKPVQEPISQKAAEPSQETTEESEEKPVADAEDGLWREMDALDIESMKPEDRNPLLADARTDPFQTIALLRRWVSADPAECWETLVVLIAEGRLQRQHVSAVLRTWAEFEAERALEAALKLETDYAGSLAGSILLKILKADFERGIALLPDAVNAGAELNTALDPSPWMEAEPERICRQLAAFPKDRVRQIASPLGAAALAWYRKDAEAAVDWVLKLSPELGDLAYRQIAREMAEKGETESLVAFHAAMLTAGDRERIGSTLFSHLMKKDPALVCQWATGHLEGKERHGYIASAISYIGSKSKRFPPVQPEVMATAMGKVPEGKGKGENALKLFQKWKNTEPAKAADWMAQLHPLSYSYIRDEAAGTWTGADARAWVKGATASPFANDLLKAIVRRLSRTSPAEARAFIASLPDSRADLVKQAGGN